MKAIINTLYTAVTLFGLGLCCAAEHWWWAFLGMYIFIGGCFALVDENTELLKR